MALLPPDPVYTIRNVDNVPVYSLAFSFLPGGLERLLAGSKNGYVYAYNLQVRSKYSDPVTYLVVYFNICVESVKTHATADVKKRGFFVYYPHFVTQKINGGFNMTRQIIESIIVASVPVSIKYTRISKDILRASTAW